MTKLRIRDYEPADFLDIEVSEYEMKARIGIPLAQQAWIKKHSGPCYTLVDPEDRIVACCGISNFWPGVGELWITLSPLVHKYPYTVIALRKLLEAVKQWYVRIQATSPVGYPDLVSFNKHFGAKFEGVLRKYGPHGESHLLYAWVKGKAND